MGSRMPAPSIEIGTVKRLQRDPICSINGLTCATLDINLTLKTAIGFGSLIAIDSFATDKGGKLQNCNTNSVVIPQDPIALISRSCLCSTLSGGSAIWYRAATIEFDEGATSETMKKE